MFTLNLNDAKMLRESYKKEIETIEKNLEAVRSLAYLLDVHIASMESALLKEGE